MKNFAGYLPLIVRGFSQAESVRLTEDNVAFAYETKAGVSCQLKDGPPLSEYGPQDKKFVFLLDTADSQLTHVKGALLIDKNGKELHPFNPKAYDCL